MLGTLRTIVPAVVAATAILVAALLIVVEPGEAVAQSRNVKRLIKQLRTGKDYKIRLSAAANLGKLGDLRAVKPLTAALRSDKDRNVRGVCATSLGKLVTGATPKRQRKQAMAALERAADKDASSFVRTRAAKALDGIGGDGGPAKGGIYVNVGAMSDKASSSGSLRALMRKTVAKTLTKSSSSMVTAWPGGKEPTAKQLKAQKTSGFHVDGTLVSLSTQAKGSSVLVSCKISMLIATYPKKSMFGMLSGGAKVQADDSPKSLEYAQQDCVTAVLEDLVTRKIIPTIKARSN